MDIQKYSIYAPTVVRLAVALVFLWFGVNQLLFPGDFLGYVPDAFGSYAETLVFVNGIFETIFGWLLLVGYFTRAVAFVLGLHLLSIAFGLGYNDIMVRDVGLALVTLSIALGGADSWSLDKKLS